MYAIGSPNFVSYGKTCVNFIMNVIFRYACKQFVKRPTWGWNWGNNNFAFYDAYFYERIVFQLSVNGKGFWYSDGEAIAPFLDFCEHKVISCLFLQQRYTFLLDFSSADFARDVPTRLSKKHRNRAGIFPRESAGAGRTGSKRAYVSAPNT
jgi:hypothetical protein